MEQVKGLMKEMYDISNELKRLNKQTTELRSRKADLEKGLTKWMQDNNHTGGVKYKDLVFLLEKKKQHKKPKKKEQPGKISEALRDAGVDNHALVAQIVEKLKGEEEETTKLKVVNRY